MKSKEVLKLLNVTRATLCKYVKNETIKVDNTINGHYIYNDDSVYSFIGIKKNKKKKINVIYSRTSNPPKKYLEEQENRLLNFCTSNGIVVDKTYKDLKSGMNFDRNEFQNLIKDVVSGEVELIVVENKDRLCRFGFELFENFCKFFGTKIVVANNASEKTYEQELTEDLLSIIHYFSMKSYSHRRKLNKIKKELENADIKNSNKNK